MYLSFGLSTICLSAEKGEWNKNVSLFKAAKVVTNDVISQWNKTNIPHVLHGKNGTKKITDLLTKYQALCKIPRGRRKEGFGMKLNDLFDVSACQHEDMNNCACGTESKVPLN